MHPRTPLAAGLDTAIVVAFVAIGRRNHDEDSAAAGLIDTAAPFLIALAFSWLVFRVWRRPVDWTTGVQVWATTVAAGMLLRRVLFDDGTALSFVIVASVFLGVFLLGWRLVLRLTRGSSTPGPQKVIHEPADGGGRQSMTTTAAEAERPNTSGA